MKLDKRLIPFAGFLAGFAPVAVWNYLHWAPLSWSLIAGVAVAVLFSVIWAIPDVRPRIRMLAVVTLELVAIGYVVIVAGILSVSDCGFIDGRLYCTHRYF